MNALEGGVTQASKDRTTGAPAVAAAGIRVSGIGHLVAPVRDTVTAAVTASVTGVGEIGHPGSGVRKRRLRTPTTASDSDTGTDN